MANNKSAFGRSILTLAVLFVAAALALTGVNSVTAPIIAGNADSQQYAPLYSLLPEATGFNKLYVSGEETELVDVPETVQGIYQETSGMGYALRLSTTQGYTGNAIELTLGVNLEGKISGVELTAYPETKDFGAEYPQTYIGQDSTLADAALVAGVTYSSAAFKNAIADGFAALTANGLIQEALKSDDQILEELLPQVYPGIANKSGMAQYEEQEVAEGEYAYITRIMMNMNEAGCAYFTTDGEKLYLAIRHQTGGLKLYDTTGAEVSGDPAFADMLAEVEAHADDNLKAPKKAAKKLRKMVSDEAEYAEIDLSDVFTSVTSAYTIADGGETFYGFVCNPFGYNNLPMELYFLLDANGAIVEMNVDELIFFEEYFTDYELDEKSYKAGFAGLTGESWTGEQALITGATFSSDGVADATDDMFELYTMLQENGGNNE